MDSFIANGAPIVRWGAPCVRASLSTEVRHASLLGALGSRRLRRRVIDDVDPTAASSLSYVGESPYHHNWTAARLGRQRKRESAPTNGNLAHRSIPRFRQNNLLDLRKPDHRIGRVGLHYGFEVVGLHGLDPRRVQGLRARLCSATRKRKRDNQECKGRDTQQQVTHDTPPVVDGDGSWLPTA